MSAGVDAQVRSDVSEVLVRYTTGIDRKDWALFRTCFTDDCHADYGDIGVWEGGDAITAWMEQSHAPCGYTLHRITNEVVSPSAGGVAARSYVDAVVLGPDNENGARVAGFYDDELVETADGWKIASRRFTLVLMQMIQAGAS